MKWTKKLTSILCGVLCLCSLVGCGKEQEEEPSMVVYRYGDAAVTYGEFYIYAKTVEEDYQKLYGNGIWSLELTTDDGKSSVRDVTIRDLVSNINRVKVLTAQAEEQDIVLSQEEEAQVENEAELFYNGLTEQDLQDTGLTRDVVVTVMEENMLASKVYQQVIADYDFEISEEEARMTTFYDMVFECYEIEKDGTVSEFTDEKKATQLERANEALATLAQEEDADFEELIDKYNLQYSASYTMSRTEMVEEYGDSVADQILSLSDGEISTVVQSEYGYHIFKMLQLNDAELTKKNKADIIAQKQKEYFNGIYEGWAKKYDSHFSMEDVDQDMLTDFPFAVSE
jgi:parvulin-like peptidyl-prolyl isomerase